MDHLACVSSGEGPVAPVAGAVELPTCVETDNFVLFCLMEVLSVRSDHCRAMGIG